MTRMGLRLNRVMTAEGKRSRRRRSLIFKLNALRLLGHQLWRKAILELTLLLILTHPLDEVPIPLRKTTQILSWVLRPTQTVGAIR